MYIHIYFFFCFLLCDQPGEVSKCRQQNVEKKMSTRKRRQIKMSTEQNVDTENVESSNTAKSPPFTLTCTLSPSKEAPTSFNHGKNLETLQFLIFALTTFSLSTLCLSTICAVDVFLSTFSLSTKDFRHFATFPNNQFQNT